MPIRGSQQLTEALRMLGLRLPPADTPQAQLPTDPADFEQRLANPSVMEPSWLTMLRTGKDLVKGTITGGGEQPGQTPENLGAIISAILPMLMARVPTFKRATGDVVGGLRVRRDIPNTSSIGASFNDYKVLPGLREVPVLPGKPSYASASEEARVRRLAEEIAASGEINPLIMAVEPGKDYILEGGHRYDALSELGIKSFPAMVVRDNEALRDAWAARGKR